ncbi:hypothetical protein [Streptomyces sp. 3213.3]|uniref:hypothetical protein n=1 Tax=Streptomyces sp. 3213.3 TaxID=1855348 RepID=UPI000B869527|nr:hypothetical protein [Streptomyces sp. 3213.3]
MSPVDALSGRTQRITLNRGGDRQANSALYTIVLARLRRETRGRSYAGRRIAEGKTGREASRCYEAAVSLASFLFCARSV